MRTSKDEERHTGKLIPVARGNICYKVFFNDFSPQTSYNEDRYIFSL